MALEQLVIGLHFRQVIAEEVQHDLGLRIFERGAHGGGAMAVSDKGAIAGRHGRAATGEDLDFMAALVQERGAVGRDVACAADEEELH